MDTYITSSIIIEAEVLPNTSSMQPELSQAQSNSLTAVMTEPVLTGKAKRLKNLKPYPKGVSGNAKGNPKGYISAHAAIRRAVTRKEADKIAEVVVENAMSGSHRDIETILKLEQAPGFTNTPTVAIQQNNNSMDINLVELAKELLRQSVNQ